jgi:hypothetical protein
MLRWQWISLHLWPFAMQHASYLNNHLPGKDRLSKTKVFCETQSPIKMKNLHTFGCPAYVLVEPLQSSNSSVSHFHHRTHIGIYIGHSPQHTGNVALILNPQTGCTSPQYHVVFVDNSPRSMTSKTASRHLHGNNSYRNMREHPKSTTTLLSCGSIAVTSATYACCPTGETWMPNKMSNR